MSAPPLKAAKFGIANLFVARPLFGIVINLLILIAGLAALTFVDVREIPDVDQPVLSIRASYDGAVPATVDGQVTQVLEDALSALEGLSYIESTSSTGSSRITIDLSEGTDVDIAANEAREIVSAISRQSVGNTLDISKEVRIAVRELRADLSEGIDIIITSDDGVFIESSIDEVAKSIGLATVIVVAVIFALHGIERLMPLNALRARPRRRQLPKDQGSRIKETDLSSRRTCLSGGSRLAVQTENINRSR